MYTYAFNSARKRMSTVVDSGNGAFVLHCKGAAEIILKLCTSVLLADGSRVPLDQQRLDQLHNQIDQLTGSSLRVLCLATREFTEPLNWASLLDDPPEKSMTCVAIIGILDPLRAGVPGAVKACQDAGITVRMVTGDNLTTAKKIAQQCGIYTPSNEGIALEGPEFARLCEADPGMYFSSHILPIRFAGAIDRLLPNLQVLARSSPTDKYNLVKMLKHNSQIVAVTVRLLFLPQTSLRRHILRQKKKTKMTWGRSL